MQNRYFGDVGDYGKYGLLRCLCGTTLEGAGLKLGVIWCLVEDEVSTNDGRHISYLNILGSDKPCSRCDPELYAFLKRNVVDGKRSVSCVQDEKCGMLPMGTVFCDELITFGNLGPLEWKERRSLRDKWLEGLFSLTKECDVIFFDPDNGLEVKSESRSTTKGRKHIFYDELRRFFRRGQSIVFYQHLNRHKTAEKEIETRVNEIKTELGGEEVWALRFHRGTGRVFFVIPHERHQFILASRINNFMSSNWAKHKFFTMMTNALSLDS